MKTPLFLALMLATSVCAAPMYRAANEGIVITLDSDKCALKEVANLPKKAFWVQDGKTIEGCWGVSPLGVVNFYFADRTVVAIPQDVFHKVQVQES
jgi:hypothetical protein